MDRQRSLRGLACAALWLCPCSRVSWRRTRRGAGAARLPRRADAQLPAVAPPVGPSVEAADRPPAVGMLVSARSYATRARWLGAHPRWVVAISLLDQRDRRPPGGALGSYNPRAVSRERG